jgi:hypothetical protein
MHGGVLVAAVSGTRLCSVTSATVAITAVTTFEAVCVRSSTDLFNCIVLAIYRPGSEAVTASFFDELTDVLDRIAAMREPIFVAGDVNIRLDRLDDQNTCHLLNLFDCYGFMVHVAGVPTHDSGGSIDIVASRSACGDPIFVAGGPVVCVLDPGLSDQPSRLNRDAASIQAGTAGVYAGLLQLTFRLVRRRAKNLSCVAAALSRRFYP